jgi:hypothetical protein
LPYQFPFSPKFFKEDLGWDAQIHRQEIEIAKTCNFGTLKEIANTVRYLEIMITKKMIPIDDTLESELDDLNEELEIHQMDKKKEYEKKINDSICPDVVKKPNVGLAPRWYYESKLSILYNFFDRLGLHLQNERQDDHF